MSQTVKAWQVAEFDDLELFRAEGIFHSYARHSHAGYAIGVIEAGVGGNSYRGTTYLAASDSIIFMDPDEPHTGYAAHDLPLTYRMLYPSVQLIQLAVGCSATGTASFREPVVVDRPLAQQIQQLHQILEQSQDALLRQTRLVEVLSTAIDRYADVELQTVAAAKEPSLIRTIKAYLHDNLAANISLDQLVELTHLNRSYLIRVFRAAVGLPPYVYLTQIRVERAKQLLQAGQPVADVSIAVGMSDQSHLSRHFKRLVGISPGRYQQMSTSFKTQPEPVLDTDS